MSDVDPEPGAFASLFEFQAELLTMAGLYPIQVCAQQRRLRDELRRQWDDIELELSQCVEVSERARLEAALRNTRDALIGYREVTLGPGDLDVDPAELRQAEARCAEAFGCIHSGSSGDCERQTTEMLFHGRFFPPTPDLDREMIRELDKLLGLD